MSEDVTSGLLRLSDRNEALALKSLAPHIAADEELVVNVAVRPNRGWVKRLRFARLHVDPASVELPRYVAIAVTSRRFFVVSHDLSGKHVSAMLMGSALEEVHSVRVDRARTSWAAGGTQYTLWTNGDFAQRFGRALRREPSG